MAAASRLQYVVSVEMICSIRLQHVDMYVVSTKRREVWITVLAVDQGLLNP